MGLGPSLGALVVVWGEDALGLPLLLGLVQQQVCDVLTRCCLFCSPGRSEKEEGQLPGALAEAPTVGLLHAPALGLPGDVARATTQQSVQQPWSGASTWLPPGCSGRSWEMRSQVPKLCSWGRVRRAGAQGLFAHLANASQGLSYALYKRNGHLTQTPPPAP